ncbi:Desumoylating isopeptidase 1 [Lecanosticta acicola]|uniref:Desumoylating isopeptidase 1 n=1 Tax=Lecanosticta acicola TaxID=111012 RepID=A0AAI8YRV6_9PEZI|nr:Desumoylating isopeptidase 1 [Lecanosticta acicola]
MDVQLYVYDLTRGMAKAISQQLLGIHIEAVYHTSLVFGDIEYFFGAGVQTCYPGTTHHGQPMEIIPLGTTHLPMETIMEYLESLKEVYTPESYDLFAHNCNNFTNDFAMFLVGRGIPGHITSLPQKVLDTPFGQMLKPQIDASMRSITQAEVPAPNRPPPNGAASSSSGSSKVPSVATNNEVSTNGSTSRYGKVINLSSLTTLQEHTAAASDTCVTIFFTSSTCAPCRLAYPMFDNLAGENPQALFVKVDINAAQDVAMRYQIRATPTFMTFSKGAKQDEWSGADPNVLKSHVERLIQATFPPHRHLTLKVPTLQFGSMRPVTYAKVPPLDKLMAKIGSSSTQKDLVALRTFLEKRSEDPKEAPLPDLHSMSKTFQSNVLALPTEVRFAAVDLLRCAMVDPRVGGYFAEENQPKTVPALIEHVNNLKDCPHNLRLVTIHLACNVFASPLYVRELFHSDDTSISQLIQLITSSLLDTTHPTTRVAAASLAFNLATSNYRVRREEGDDALAEAEQVELAASLLETFSDEDSADATKALLLAFGYLIYCAPEDGELFDLCGALNAKAKIMNSKGHDSLTTEVASLL